VNWFAFDSLNNPITTGSTEIFRNQNPFKSEKVNKLDYAWWGGIKSGERKITQFLTIAEGTTDVQAGNYEISVTWDDAVKVYLDDKLIINEWNPSNYKFDESPNKKVELKLSKGLHSFRVEHAELGGFATLSLKLKKLG